MKKVLHIINEVFSWAFVIGMIALLFYSIFAIIDSKKEGTQPYLFGYRPVYILSGSMEPKIQTNGIVITQEVKDCNELKQGDVVTFKVFDEENQDWYRITHRIQIVNTEKQFILTKGDNNSYADGIQIPFKDVEAKVVSIWNWFATVVALWATTKGKFILIGIPTAIILIFASIKLIFSKQ